MTFHLSGRPEPAGPESDLDARRRAADADPAAASQAAAFAAALAQAQSDVVTSLRHVGPLAVGTINGAQIAADSITRHVLTFSDVVARDHWDGPLRDIVVQLHRAAVNADAERLGVTPQWHTARGPWATEQRWAANGHTDDGRPLTGTTAQPTDTGTADDHTHYLVTTTVTVIPL